MQTVKSCGVMKRGLCNNDTTKERESMWVHFTFKESLGTSLSKMWRFCILTKVTRYLEHAPTSDYMDCEYCDTESKMICMICKSSLCFFHARTHFKPKTKGNSG